MKSDEPQIPTAISIGASWFLVGAIALLGAATNDHFYDFVLKFQTLFTSIVGFGIACVAYYGATSTARENQRKNNIERLEQQLTHAIKLHYELDEQMAFRASVRDFTKSIFHKDMTPEKFILNCRCIGKETAPSLRNAMESIGSFPPSLREHIAAAAHRFDSITRYASGLTTLKDETGAPELLTFKIFRKSLADAWNLYDSAASELAGSVHSFLAKNGIQVRLWSLEELTASGLEPHEFIKKLLDEDSKSQAHPAP